MVSHNEPIKLATSSDVTSWLMCWRATRILYDFVDTIFTPTISLCRNKIPRTIIVRNNNNHNTSRLSILHLNFLEFEYGGLRDLPA